MRKAVTYIGALLLGLVILGFSVQMETGMPDNAILLVDPQTRIYYAPPYLRDNRLPADNLVAMRSGDIEGKNYNPDPTCRDGGYFLAEDAAPLVIYQIAKVLNRNGKRWNADGTWNW